MTSDIPSKAMNILSAAEQQGIEVRLIGALSIKLHCDRSKEHFDRPISDIDFVGRAKDRVKIDKLLRSLRYEAADMFNYVNPERLLFFDSDGTRVDVFLDVFQMCHRLDFRDRIALDRPTLPPADLLATKLQIVELNEKDLKDMISLLRDHELSQTDASKDTINTGYLSDLCAKDWGVYRTFTGNIKNISEYLLSLPIANEEKESIEAKLDELFESIESRPKSMKWKMRARIGDKKVWYNQPETRIMGESKDRHP